MIRGFRDWSEQVYHGLSQPDHARQTGALDVVCKLLHLARQSRALERSVDFTETGRPFDILVAVYILNHLHGR